MELTSRQETILGLIVREFVDSATPVSSLGLCEKFNLPFSAATVRNEMAILTERGLIRQPHTSAGRVPTEEGYRYFVQRLVGEVELPMVEQNTISHQFHQAGEDLSSWMRLAASVLSHHTRGAALITLPHARSARFKHIELISTQGRQILLVLVLAGGEVRQQMLNLAEPAPQSQLSDSAARLNSMFENYDSNDIRNSLSRLNTFEQEIARVIADMTGQSMGAASGDIIYDGVSRVLAEPGFANSDAAVYASRVLEEQSFLQDFLAKVLSPNVGSVQVVIGGEGDWEELKDCSMVLARYGVTNVATGALGVLGPTRMAYGRAISTVRYVAELMSDLMHDAYGEA